MLITDDSEWILLDTPPNNVVVTTSSSLSSTSTLIHLHPTGDHTNDATATTTATSATTSASATTAPSTEIPLPISDLAPRIRHLIDPWKTCQTAWKKHKQHRIMSHVRTSMQHLHTWFHHTTTRDWQHITGWLYVPYPKLCDGFFYFILIGMCLVSFLSLTYKRISFAGVLGNILLIAMGAWTGIYALLISCLMMGIAYFTVRSWWRPSVYIIPIPITTPLIPYSRTIIAVLLSLLSITLYPLPTISPFHYRYEYTIIRTLAICIFGYPVWRGWYDIRDNMETLHAYYTGMGDITRLKVKHMEKQQHQQQQQQQQQDQQPNTHPYLHTRQEQQQTSLRQLDSATSFPSPTVISPEPIPTTTCAAFALFFSQFRRSSSPSSSSSSSFSFSFSSPTPSHVTLCQLHVTTWLTCVMIGVYSIVVGGLVIGNAMN